MDDDTPYTPPRTSGHVVGAKQRPVITVRTFALALTVGLLTSFLVYPSVPHSDAVRFGVSMATWIFGTGTILIVYRAVMQRSPVERPMIYVALSGWTTACVAAASVVSLLQALHQYARESYMTPEEWIWCRGVLVGLVLASIPVTFVLAVSRSQRATVFHRDALGCVQEVRRAE